MRKPIKYLLGILGVILALFLSLDIQKLDEHQASSTTAFNAVSYARRIWDTGILPAITRAPEFTGLLEMLENDPESAFSAFGRKLGISNTLYFMVSGEGIIESVEEDDLLVSFGNGIQARIATGFIFGNAVRDGSGAADIDDFINMTDFNQVSVELNQLVKAQVVPELKESARAGMKLKFTGAFELSEDEPDPASIRIIPVSIQLFNE